MKKGHILEPHPLYHNTLKLLQNYRDVHWSLEVSSLDLQSEFRAEYGRVPSSLVDDVAPNADARSASRIEAFSNSLEKSRRMLQIIDSAIELLRQKHKKGELYYWILYYTYLSAQEPDTINEILIQLEKHFPAMSIRTYYSRREEAIQILSSILWGYTSKECQGILDQFDLGCYQQTK